MSDQLQCRFARTEEIGDVAKLVAHSFPGATRSPAWWHEQLRDPRFGGGAGTLLVGFSGDRLVAACQVHPLRQWIGGEAFAVAGIGTVAISPAHRKRRFGASLVVAALLAARERGDVASALYPFRTSFYQKLGYGAAGFAEQWQVSPAMLLDSPERLRVELLDDAARAEALELYGTWVVGQTGQLERTERMWTHICAAPERALFGYRDTAGALAGYALATYRTDLPRATRYLEVDELVWTTAAARRGLFAWLASLGDQWEQLLIRTLPSHRLADRIREPRLPLNSAPDWSLWAPAATLMMGPMFRLLDVHTAWQRRTVNAGRPLTVALELEDAHIDANRGRWRLAFEDGRTTVERAAAADLTLHLDVSTLSRLFIAALSPSAALDAELLRCDHAERLPELDAVLALPEPWTFDRF